MRILLILLILSFSSVSFADYFPCAFNKARPNAQFAGNSGNTSNLQKACERYIGGDCPDQEEIDAKIPDCMLEEVRGNKQLELEAELILRVGRYLPALNNKEKLGLEYHRWVSIVPAAKNPDATYGSAIAHYSPWKSATDTIDAFDNISAINAFDSFTGLP